MKGKGRLVSRRKEGKDAKEIVKDVRRKARRQAGCVPSSWSSGREELGREES